MHVWNYSRTIKCQISCLSLWISWYSICLNMKACMPVCLDDMIVWLSVSDRSQSGMWAVPSLLMLLAISNPKDQVASPKKTKRMRSEERRMNANRWCKLSRYSKSSCHNCQQFFLWQRFKSPMCGKVDSGPWKPLQQLLKCVCVRVCWLTITQLYVTLRPWAFVQWIKPTLYSSFSQQMQIWVFPVENAQYIFTAVNNKQIFFLQTNGTDTMTKKSASLTGEAWFLHIRVHNQPFNSLLI